VLGLRLVKRTVNFDDPETYHLYYGDEIGNPGTIITFFPWRGAPRGRPGVGQLTVTAFSIPVSSTGYWVERLKAYAIPFGAPVTRFDEEVISLFDPDGLQLGWLPIKPPISAAPGKPVTPEHSIRGFYGVTLAERSLQETEAMLTGVMGFQQVAEAETAVAFKSARRSIESDD
jgi:glyoxalase family protein